MWINKIAWAVCMVAISATAYANIKIDNHTGFYGTGKMDLTPCSSISSSGVLKPYGSLDIPKAAIDTFCGLFDCMVDLYMSNNCSGKRVAVARVNARKGIVSIKSLDTSKVRISGRGNYASVDPV